MWIQEISVLVLVAADLGGFWMHHTSLYVAALKALVQAVLGGILPTLLLQCMEHSAFLQMQRSCFCPSKKAC
jgi:hypothetical protein